MTTFVAMTGSHHYSDEYIAIGEVARFCGVTVGTIRNWERNGRITAVRTPAGHRRFRRSDVQAMLRAEASV